MRSDLGRSALSLTARQFNLKSGLRAASAALRPLLGVPSYVATTPGHCEDQALFAQDVDGAEHSVAADAVLLLKLLDRRQGTAPPLALGDPCPEDGG